MMTFLFVTKPKLILKLYSYSGDIKINLILFLSWCIYIFYNLMYIKTDSVLRVRTNNLPILLNNAEISHLEIAENCFSSIFQNNCHILIDYS